MVASILNPMGYIAPFTLLGKQILQDMCRENVGWDDPLSEDLATRWERHLAPKKFGDIVSRELHHFQMLVLLDMFSSLTHKFYSYLRIVNA